MRCKKNNTGSKIINYFLTTLKYYQFIKNDPGMERMFNATFKAKYPTWLNGISVDSYIYEGKYREALQTLRNNQQIRKPEVHYYLKMATCHYGLKDSNSTAEQAIAAVQLFNNPSSKGKNYEKYNQNALQRPTIKSRHLHFLPPAPDAVLSYVTRLLINLLKDKGFAPPSIESDWALGHVIVLLQYTWPTVGETDLFYQILHRIKRKESFTYPLFSQYVVQIEFLEEFMALALSSENGGGMALDIVHPMNAAVSTSTSSTPPSRRVGTRGANRGEKEEINTAIKRQVLRSHENLDKIIIDFLMDNRDSIFKCLI